jgi:hypothetical protein
MIGLKIEYKHKNGLSRSYNFYFPLFFQRDTGVFFWRFLVSTYAYDC